MRPWASKISLTRCILRWRQRMAESSFSQDENPFRDLKISSWEPLKAVAGRSPCPRCNCSRKFYCYDCYEVVGIDPALVPRVRLPLKVDIIKHPGEVTGKSTAIHARILSPDDVKIHVFPNVPDYAHPSRTMVVFPAQDALTVEELASEMKQLASQRVGQPDTSGSVEECWKTLDRIVFVDSTWTTTGTILRNERIKALKSVKLMGNAQTHFWRPQRLSSSHLATIEAIYYFFREVEAALSKRPYQGDYDNLLYFFAYQHGVVQRAMKQAAVEKQQEIKADADGTT